eukprot:848427_1
MACSCCSCAIQRRYFITYNTIATFLYFISSLSFSICGLITTINTNAIQDSTYQSLCPHLLNVSPSPPNFIVLFAVGIGHILQILYTLYPLLKLKTFMAQWNAVTRGWHARVWMGVSWRFIWWLFMIWMLSYWRSVTYHPANIYDHDTDCNEYMSTYDVCLASVVLGCCFIMFAVSLVITDCCCKIVAEEAEEQSYHAMHIRHDIHHPHEPESIKSQRENPDPDQRGNEVNDMIFEHHFYHRHRTRKQKKKDQKEAGYKTSPELRTCKNKCCIAILTVAYYGTSFGCAWYLFHGTVNGSNMIQDDGYKEECLSQIDTPAPSKNIMFATWMFCILIAVVDVGSMCSFILCNFAFLSNCNSWYKVFTLLKKGDMFNIVARISILILSIYLLSFWEDVRRSPDGDCQESINVPPSDFDENPSANKVTHSLQSAVYFSILHVVTFVIGLAMYYVWKQQQKRKLSGMDVPQLQFTTLPTASLQQIDIGTEDRDGVELKVNAYQSVEIHNEYPDEMILPMQQIANVILWYDEFMSSSANDSTKDAFNGHFNGDYDIVALQNDYHYILQQFNNEQNRDKIQEAMKNLIHPNQLQCYSSSCKCISEYGLTTGVYLDQLLKQIHCFALHDSLSVRRSVNHRFTTFVSSAECDENKRNEKAVNMYQHGHKYYYHDFAKDNHNIDIYDNIGDTYHQWHVTAYHPNFKHEITENATMATYIKILEKGREKQTTEQCRRLKASIESVFQYGNNQYQIKNNSPIQFHHLIAIIAYTDEDDLQSKFTNTFWRLSSTESLQEMIARHSKFYFLAKYLLEAVEVFGDEWTANKNPPFVYHGLNQKMYFPQSIARFFHPVSTTIHRNVALDFATENGLILSLKSIDSVKYFECPWISGYPDEGEYLFVGGYAPLRIIEIEDVFPNPMENKEYNKEIAALNNIQQLMMGSPRLITNDLNDDDEVTHTMVQMLQNDTSSLPEYIQTLYKHYRQNVKQVTIDWSLMYSAQFGYFNLLKADYESNNQNDRFFDINRQHITINIAKLCELFPLQNLTIKTETIVLKLRAKRVIDGILNQLEKHSTCWKKQEVNEIKIVIYTPYTSAPRCGVCCSTENCKRKAFFKEMGFSFTFKGNLIAIVNNSSRSNDQNDDEKRNINQPNEDEKEEKKYEDDEEQSVILRVKETPGKPSIGYCDTRKSDHAFDVFVVDGHRRNFDLLSKSQLIYLSLFRWHNRTIFIWFNLMITVYYLIILYSFYRLMDGAFHLLIYNTALLFMAPLIVLAMSISLILCVWELFEPWRLENKCMEKLVVLANGLWLLYECVEGFLLIWFIRSDDVWSFIIFVMFYMFSYGFGAFSVGVVCCTSCKCLNALQSKQHFVFLLNANSSCSHRCVTDASHALYGVSYVDNLSRLVVLTIKALAHFWIFYVWYFMRDYLEENPLYQLIFVFSNIKFVCWACSLLIGKYEIPQHLILRCFLDSKVFDAFDEAEGKVIDQRMILVNAVDHKKINKQIPKCCAEIYKYINSTTIACVLWNIPVIVWSIYVVLHHVSIFCLFSYYLCD